MQVRGPSSLRTDKYCSSKQKLERRSILKSYSNTLVLISALSPSISLPDEQDNVATFDSHWITQHLKEIKHSIIKDQRDVSIEISLELIERHTNRKLCDLAEFHRKLACRDTELKRFNDELTERLMGKYELLLRQRRQYDVLGIIQFTEEEMFPQYPGYRATFEELVYDHCKEKM